MPGIHNRRETFASISESDYDFDDSENNVYCEHCASFGFPNEKMGKRYYRQSELINGQVPADWQNWLMCYRCGNVVAKIHAKHENNTIVGIKEVPDSPYEKNEFVMLPVHDKSLARTKIKRNKKSRTIRDSAENTDFEIISAKQKGYKVSNITEYNRY